MSFIYEITCKECGKELEMKDAEIDGSLDLLITVTPCEVCIEDRVREAVKEYKDGA